VSYHDPKSHAWTAEADQLLLAKVQECGFWWETIAAFFPGRSGSALKNRYYAMQRRKIKPIPSRENVAAPGEEELLHDIASEEALLADIGAPGEEAFRYDVVDPEPWDLLDPLLNPMDSRNNKAPDPSDPFPWDFP
jgi:hypothetical protein